MSKLNPAQELSKAIELAGALHYDQFDKGGKPYVLHVLKVMHYLKSDDYQLNSIAALHDSVEDTSLTFEGMEKMGFSARVIQGIGRLTKQRGHSHNEYLRGVLQSKDACQVKLCDLRHNTDIRRLKGLREKDFTRMKKYHKMHMQIKSMLQWYELNNAVDYPSASSYLNERDCYIKNVMEVYFED